MKIRHSSVVALMLALAGATSAQMCADSLADRVPADALGFMSWAGSDALGTAYSDSHLKGLLDALHLPQFISRRIDEKQNAETDPDKRADQKVLQDFLQSVMKAPSAFYFGPVDFSNADAPQFKMAFYSKVGHDKAKSLAAAIFPIIERRKKAKDPTVTATAVGDYLLIAVGAVPGMEKRLSGAVPTDGLGSLPAYQKTMQQVGGADAAALVYIDGQAVMKLADDGIAAQGGRGADMWPKISDAFGLRAVGQFALAGKFDGANWSSRLFLGLDPRRVGFMALFDNKPLGDDTLKLIPKDVAWAGVTRFDAGRMLQDLRDGITQMDPQNGGRNFDNGLQQFFAFTGVDAKKDIIDQLGDAYAIYARPGGAGHSFADTVIATRPKDAKKLEESLTTLESVISTMMAQRAANAATFTTDAMPAPNDKVTVHTIATPAISPAWAVADGVLYFSLSPDGVKAAVENGGKHGSITENPEYAALWKKVGNPRMSSFGFVDYGKLAAQVYPLAEKRIAAYKANHPDENATYTLPPLDKITPNLTPAMSVYWSDKDGFHMKATGPAPMLDMVRGELLLRAAVKSRLQVSSAAAPGKNMP